MVNAAILLGRLAVNCNSYPRLSPTGSSRTWATLALRERTGRSPWQAVVQKSIACQKVQLWDGKPFHSGIKSAALFLCKTVTAQMGIGTGDLKVWKVEDICDFRPPVPGDPKAVHTCVDFNVDLDRLIVAIQIPGIGTAHNRLRQVVLVQKGCLS